MDVGEFEYNSALGVILNIDSNQKYSKICDCHF